MAARPIPILLYHSVSSDPQSWIARFTLTPATFDEHVAAIVDSGRTPLTVSGLVDALATGTLPPRPVVVTFDDGFADTAEVAGPRLLERGITFTAYITTAFMHAETGPGGERMLGPSAVHELAATGVEIGAHSHTHPELDTLPRAAVRTEVETCKALLETALGARVRSFAYPHGCVNRMVRDAVRRAGFDSACAVGNALTHRRDDILGLARLMVESDTTSEQVTEWLKGEDAPLAPQHERVRTRVRRVYRRVGAVTGLSHPVPPPASAEPLAQEPSSIAPQGALAPGDDGV